MLFDRVRWGSPDAHGASKSSRSSIPVDGMANLPHQPLNQNINDLGIQVESEFLAVDIMSLLEGNFQSA